MSLTAKQIYDLNNMNVAAQNISLGTSINALQEAETSGSAAIVTNQEDIAKNAEDISSNQGDIDVLEGEMNAVESSIADIEDGTTDSILSTYSYAELPTPSEGMLVYCTDGNSGSACLALASGSTTWLTVTIGSELSGSAA